MIKMDDVEHIARLARLRLTDEEKALYLEQLNKILGYMGKLNELDTTEVEPTFHAVPKKNVFRADEIIESLAHEKALGNSTSCDEDFFLVPPVIEE